MSAPDAPSTTFPTRHSSLRPGARQPGTGTAAHRIRRRPPPSTLPIQRKRSDCPKRTSRQQSEWERLPTGARWRVRFCSARPVRAAGIVAESDYDFIRSTPSDPIPARQCQPALQCRPHGASLPRASSDRSPSVARDAKNHLRHQKLEQPRPSVVIQTTPCYEFGATATNLVESKHVNGDYTRRPIAECYLESGTVEARCGHVATGLYPFGRIASARLALAISIRLVNSDSDSWTPSRESSSCIAF